MSKDKLIRIWISTAVLSFVLEGGFSRLMQGAMGRNQLLPWHTLGARGLWLMAIVAIIGGLAFAAMFLQGYRGLGAKEGVRFGFWVTLLAGIPSTLAFAAMLPMGRRLPAEFIGADFVTFLVCGIVAAAIAGSGAAQKAGAAGA
ncbi:MAG TPA: hypothetical protein VN515_00240 [Terriglobales bacterium]|nr:hypothetical protein [Terriglobales bacterium]